MITLLAVRREPTPDALRDGFAAGLGVAKGRVDEAIERALGDLIDAALEELPGVQLDESAFASHIGQQLQELEPRRLTQAIADLRGTELVLAFACVAEDRAAVRILENEHLTDARKALASLGLDQAAREEVLQRARTRLLSNAPPGTAKLLTYRGQGPLRRWIRITAVRLVDRQARPERGNDDLLAALPDFSTPELAHVRAETKQVLRAAFADSLGALDVKERNLLRQSALDGLSIDALGRLHGVHRSTAARWLASIRQKVLKGTRARLTQRLHLPRPELESLLRCARSQLDITLDRVLDPS